MPPRRSSTPWLLTAFLGGVVAAWLLTPSRQHDGPLTIEAECFARDNVLNALTGEAVTRRMVLIDADEYERLKAASVLASPEAAS